MFVFLASKRYLLTYGRTLAWSNEIKQALGRASLPRCVLSITFFKGGGRPTHQSVQTVETSWGDLQLSALSACQSEVLMKHQLVTPRWPRPRHLPQRTSRPALGLRANRAAPTEAAHHLSFIHSIWIISTLPPECDKQWVVKCVSRRVESEAHLPRLPCHASLLLSRLWSEAVKRVGGMWDKTLALEGSKELNRPLDWARSSDCHVPLKWSGTDSDKQRYCGLVERMWRTKTGMSSSICAAHEPSYVRAWKDCRWQVEFYWAGSNKTLERKARSSAVHFSKCIIEFSFWPDLLRLHESYLDCSKELQIVCMHLEIKYVQKKVLFHLVLI